MTRWIIQFHIKHVISSCYTTRCVCESGVFTLYLLILLNLVCNHATRPLLLFVLKEQLEKLGCEEEDWQKFLTLPKSLISIRINLAKKTLQIMSDENAFVGEDHPPTSRLYNYYTPHPADYQQLIWTPRGFPTVRSRIHIRSRPPLDYGKHTFPSRYYRRHPLQPSGAFNPRRYDSKQKPGSRDP